jgi:hypothetical protein
MSRQSLGTLVFIDKLDIGEFERSMITTIIVLYMSVFVKTFIRKKRKKIKKVKFF